LSPSEFIATRHIKSICNGFLTNDELVIAKDMLLHGRRFIGDVLDDSFDDMNDDAISLMMALESFLVTFVQHCIRLEMTQKFIDESKELH
jgi:hypothetical protein